LIRLLFSPADSCLRFRSAALPMPTPPLLADASRPPAGGEGEHLDSEAARLVIEHGARWQRAGQHSVLLALAAPLLWLLLSAHAAHYALSLLLPDPARGGAADINALAAPAALAALVCLAGIVALQFTRALQQRRGTEAAIAHAALLAAGLASALAVQAGPASLALLALFVGVVSASVAHPLRLLLVGAAWVLGSLLLWRAGATAALATLQLLLVAAVVLGSWLARRLDATLARRNLRFWQTRLARRRLRALATGRARYIAAASHDLRQPLHAMSFLARALLDRFADDREMTVVLRRLEQATTATDQMFRDLLQLTQLDSSSIALRMSDVPLATLFESLQSTHTPVASRKGLVLQFYKTDAVVRSDPVALLRILNNLVSNAIRYTDRGSVEVRASRNGFNVQVRVRDTGPGIAAADQQVIFEEFRQLSGGRGGTGLGLAIARRLAQALGHAITLESAPGKGSVFSLSLAAAERNSETSTVGALTAPAQDKLILFVENDEDVRKAVRPVMESWGYSVIDAPNGVEAEERLSALMTVPEVMIVDQDLGGGEVADDVVRRIRQAYGAAIPSLVVTGNLNTQALGERLSTLHKPVDPEELRKAVESARRSARQTSKTPQTPKIPR
jgi:signal transduction histidine kinase